MHKSRRELTSYLSIRWPQSGRLKHFLSTLPLQFKYAVCSVWLSVYQTKQSRDRAGQWCICAVCMPSVCSGGSDCPLPVNMLAGKKLNVLHMLDDCVSVCFSASGCPLANKQRLQRQLIAGIENQDPILARSIKLEGSV